MRKRIDFIVAGAETERYHTVRTLQTETVGHHSHGVAILTHLLGGSPEAVVAALTHDLAEHVLGDLPAPAKRQYGIGEQVNALEARLLQDVGLSSTLSAPDKRALKLADIFQGMLFCTRERELGNTSMSVVYHRYKSYALAFVLVGAEQEMFNAIEERYGEC